MSKAEKHVEYWPNGQKKEEGTFKDGKQEGKWTWWYENGQKKHEGNYKDNLRYGEWTYWYKNGQKKVEGTRKDVKLIEVTWWDEDGNVIKQFPPHHICYF